MRIAIDARMVKPKIHGIGRYAYSLIEHLAKIDHENHYDIIVNDYRPLNFLVGKARFRLHKTSAIPIFPSEQVLIPNLLRREKTSVFHSPSFVAPLNQPCGAIMTIHDTIPLIFPEQHFIMYPLYFEYFIKPAAQKARKILTVSEHSKSDIVKYLSIPENKITVTYNATNGQYHPVRDRSLLVRVKNKYKIPGNFILYVGSDAPHKNLPRLVKAYHELLKMTDISHLLVISANSNGKLSGLVNRLGLKKKVLLVGDIKEADIPPLYNAADLFVYPSLYEGFGLPPLEAMACGTPVITSKTSAMPEVTDGAAILVDPYDVGEISRAMYRVLRSEALRRELTDKGIRRAKYFSWEKTAKKTLEVYQEVYERRAG